MKEFARTSLINEPSLVLASLLGFFSDACHIVTFTYVLSVSDCVNMLGKRRFGNVVGQCGRRRVRPGVAGGERVRPATPAAERSPARSGRAYGRAGLRASRSRRDAAAGPGGRTVRGQSWLQRGGHAVQARVEGSMIAPGAERRRRTWQRREAPALSRGRAPRSSRRSRAGVGELVRAWVRRPARCAAARVLRPARARAQSTAEPWRPAASPRAVARGGFPRPTPPTKRRWAFALRHGRGHGGCPWRRCSRVGQSQRHSAQVLRTGSRNETARVTVCGCQEL